MSNSIEAKIHNILLDIDPSLHKDYDEQAVIIAESTANYKMVLAKHNIKTASKQDNEALMIDCILKSMNSMVVNSTPKYTYASYPVDNDGDVDYEAVLRNFRFSSQDIDAMDIINDDDLDSFLENQDESDPYFTIADIFDDQRPNSEIYESNGQKKHRSDSQAR